MPKITKHHLQHVPGNKDMKCEFKHAFTLHRQRSFFPLHANLMRVDMSVDLSVYGEALRPLYLEAIADKTRRDWRGNNGGLCCH